MAYTVKQLARLSGVTIRSLHHYDGIGLLKPAYYGENQYRYYEEEQLLVLQQILFFRALNFSLGDIQRILSSSDFDKLNALESHKTLLEKDLLQRKKLIKTVEKTISHLRGELKMQDKEFYYGFDSEKQKAHEKYLVENGIITQELLDESNAKVKDWNVQEKTDFIHDINRIMDELVASIDAGLKPSDKKVQTLMKEHYVWLERSWTPTKVGYLGLIDLYQTDGFSEFYTSRHPKLLVFILEAMQVFSEHYFV